MAKRLGKPGAQPVYQNRQVGTRLEDSYRATGKLKEPTLCPECGAVFMEGRWQWADKPEQPNNEMCPACLRIHDHMPAGYIKLDGDFFMQHRDEVLGLARNIEDRQKSEHPLQRIMDVVDEEDGVLITTTDAHLAHGISTAIHDAYHGDLNVQHPAGENFLRAYWHR